MLLHELNHVTGRVQSSHFFTSDGLSSRRPYTHTPAGLYPKTFISGDS